MTEAPVQTKYVKCDTGWPPFRLELVLKNSGLQRLLEGCLKEC
jgi:hypothetical protein